jgi:serine/threonine protein kinase
MSDIPESLAAALAERYLLERVVGAGGMATVYLAQDVRHKRSVAVKVVRPELGGREGGDRFLREIEVAARLQHPLSGTRTRPPDSATPPQHRTAGFSGCGTRPIPTFRPEYKRPRLRSTTSRRIAP